MGAGRVGGLRGGRAPAPGVVGAGRVGGLRGGRGTGRGESGDCGVVVGLGGESGDWRGEGGGSGDVRWGGTGEVGEAINAHQSQSAGQLACANPASSSLGGRSCWYSPTPRDLGSTRTSSAMGSCECERRPSVVIRGHQRDLGSTQTSSAMGSCECECGPSVVIRGHQRDLGSTRTSSAMGSCECECGPSVVIRGHQRSTEVNRGRDIAHLQPASERSCADRRWVECRVCHLHAVREAISMQ